MAVSWHNATVYYDCIPDGTENLPMVMAMIAVPFHIWMLKILSKDIQLPMPRDRIMLCLSISDVLQVLVSFVASFPMKASALTTRSFACRILRDVLLFFTTLTVAVSSFTIVALSVERMTICMYYLKFQRLFSKRRTTILIRCVWSVGLVMAFSTSISLYVPKEKGRTETLLSESIALQLMTWMVIFPSAAIVSIIQVRIFFFSRSRLRSLNVMPATESSRNVPDFRRRQMRIAFIAGIVAVAYIVCMMPFATVMFMATTRKMVIKPATEASILSLAMVNTIIDPFIYGIGMAHTRRILVKNIRNILSALGLGRS